MKKLSSFLSLFLVLGFFTACSTTTTDSIKPSKKVVNVKKEYYTGGMLRREFHMYDNSGMNGLRKEYGYEGRLTSKVEIANGVKHGVETLYDQEGRTRLERPYVNGRLDGVATAYYENGTPAMTITYLKGVKHGLAAKYNKDGSVLEKVTFRHGKKVR